MTFVVYFSFWVVKTECIKFLLNGYTQFPSCISGIPTETNVSLIRTDTNFCGRYRDRIKIMIIYIQSIMLFVFLLSLIIIVITDNE